MLIVKQRVTQRNIKVPVLSSITKKLFITLEKLIIQILSIFYLLHTCHMQSHLSTNTREEIKFNAHTVYSLYVKQDNFIGLLMYDN